MKRTILFSFLMILSVQVMQAQSIFIKSGRNLSNYKFSNSANEVIRLQNEIGQSYELGFTNIEPDIKRFYYGLSVGLEEYNASGSFSDKQLVWETNYGVLKGLGYFNILNKNRSSLSAKAALGFATLIHGRQQINGTRYDLLKEDEFKGLFLSPQVGLSYNLVLNNQMNLLIDYDYANQYSLTSTSEQKLSFINHSLSLGFSVNIN